MIQKHNELRFRSDLFLSSADQNSEMMDISTEQKKNSIFAWIKYGTKRRRKRKRKKKREDDDDDDLVLVEEKRAK